MSADQPYEDTGARSFEDVLRTELDAIDKTRPIRDPKRYAGDASIPMPSDGEAATSGNTNEKVEPHHGSLLHGARNRQLVGLALSGGGIRSATFNLGVLQGLAGLRLLSIFDYLSTVSGGGYIGSWLLAWLKRDGLDAVTEQLRPHRAESYPGGYKEPGQIHFLREYSNYLTPKLGWFGADTWTTVAIYLRNLTLNLLILVSVLSLTLMVPHIVAWLISLYTGDPTKIDGIAVPIFTALLLIVSAWMIGLNFNSFTRNYGASSPKATDQDSPFPRYTEQGDIQKLIVAPLILVAILGTCILWRIQPAGMTEWMIIAGTGHTLCCILAFLVAVIKGAPREEEARAEHYRDLKERVSWPAVLIPAPFVGAIGGLLFRQIAMSFQDWDKAWPIVVWGPTLITGTLCLVWIIHLGLSGRGLPDEIREWWSRLIAWTLIYSLVWILFFGIAIYGPPILIGLEDWLKATLTWAWIGSTVGSILAGRNASTKKPGGKSRALEIVGKVGPYLFIVGLLALLSLGVHYLMLGPSHYTETLGSFKTNLGKDTAVLKAIPMYWEGINSELLMHPISFLAPFLGLLAVFGFFSWRVDVNQFSMHLYYRNRLTRCYMGASNWNARTPQPFTGFDPTDDMPLCELSPNTHDEKKTRKHHKRNNEREYVGPYPLINTTLNMVGGEDLAWQQRKATSFTFSPWFSGYVVPAAEHRRPSPNLDKHAFRPTHDYAASRGFISLGTAMSISGAAASPNMGYHSSPPLTFLMTLFNVRLGWWLGNPRHNSDWNSSSPSFVLFYLLCELFGLTNDNRGYIYLSDGGHFENLGIYELVRRQCGYIVACDVAQDGDFKFADLGNAIEKCRADFGVDIDINVEPIRRRDEHGHSQWHCAIGRIRYSQVDPDAADGTIVYIKSSLSGNEPTDVLRYAAANPNFPHQSTADQWFDESQFESYRELGRHITEQVMGSIEIGEDESPEEIFLKLRERWYAPSTGAETVFSRHTSMLDKIQERIRTDKTLRFLDTEIYPEWETLMRPAGKTIPVTTEMKLPESEEERRNGFYICSAMIQLMEDVYLDLKLEEEYDHPDNRGWMNLFMHWSWSPTLRTTWTITASTYGSRFQRFCERRLALSMGNIHIRRLALPGDSDTDSRKDRKKQVAELLEQARQQRILNFVEIEIIRRTLDSGQNQATEIAIFRITPQDVTPDSTENGEASESPLAFTFGFAILDGGSIVHFRIQDHLRRMGLARRALKLLLAENTELLRTEPGRSKQTSTDTNERDRATFDRIFHSVRTEIRK